MTGGHSVALERSPLVVTALSEWPRREIRWTYGYNVSRNPMIPCTCRVRTTTPRLTLDHAMNIEEAVRGSFAYLEQPGLFSLPTVDQLRLFIEGRVKFHLMLDALYPADA